MKDLAHWTQQSTADFVYSISSTFVAQIETKMEDEAISRSEFAQKLNKSSGRVSQILNNPGNLSLRVMAEVAGSLGMKVGVIAYDDHDPSNENGPIDPDVFVNCWEHAGRPANLFDVEDAFAYRDLEDYNKAITTNLSVGHTTGYGVSMGVCFSDPNECYSKLDVICKPAKIFGSYKLDLPQQLNPSGRELEMSARFLHLDQTWHEQDQTTVAPKEKAA